LKIKTDCGTEHQ